MIKLRNVRPMLFQVQVCVSDVFNIRIMRIFKEPLNDIRVPIPARENVTLAPGTQCMTYPSTFMSIDFSVLEKRDTNKTFQNNNE